MLEEIQRGCYSALMGLRAALLKYRPKCPGQIFVHDYSRQSNITDHNYRKSKLHRMSRTFIRKIMGFADLFTADVKFSFNGESQFRTVLGSVFGLICISISLFVSSQFYYGDRINLTKEIDDRSFNFTNRLGFTISAGKNCTNWEVTADCTSNSVADSNTRRLRIQRECKEFGQYCLGVQPNPSPPCLIQNKRSNSFGYLELLIKNNNSNSCKFDNENITITLFTQTFIPDISGRTFSNMTNIQQFNLSKNLEILNFEANVIDFSLTSFLAKEIGLSPRTITSVQLGPPIRNAGLTPMPRSTNLLHIDITTSNQVTGYYIEFPPILQMVFIAIVVYQISSGLINILILNRYAKNLLYLKLSQCSGMQTAAAVKVSEGNLELAVFCVMYNPSWERFMPVKHQKYIEMVKDGKKKINMEQFIQRIANLSQLSQGRQIVRRCRVSDDNSGLICEQDKQFLTSLQAVDREQREIYQLYPPELMVEAATRS